MYSSELSDTVDPYNSQVFFCHNSYDACPSRVKARQDDFPRKMTNPQQTPFYVRSMLDNVKLNNKNFHNWHRNLRIALRHANKEYVLERAIPAEDASRAEQAAHNRHIDDDREVSCLMLACMEPHLQVQFENSTAYDMIMSLKSLFHMLGRMERYNTLKSLFDCKLSKRSPVTPHVIKMIGYIDNLEWLGFSLDKDLQTDIILHSLSDDYNSFILNFRMLDLTKTNHELLGMLKAVEVNLRANLLMVQKGKGFKKSKKGKGKNWTRNSKRYLET